MKRYSFSLTLDPSLNEKEAALGSWVKWKDVAELQEELRQLKEERAIMKGKVEAWAAIVDYEHDHDLAKEMRQALNPKSDVSSDRT